MILHNGRSRGRLRRDVWGDRGATAVEYGIMVGLIMLVIVGGVTFFGQSVKGLFVMIVASHPFG